MIDITSPQIVFETTREQTDTLAVGGVGLRSSFGAVRILSRFVANPQLETARSQMDAEGVLRGRTKEESERLLAFLKEPQEQLSIEVALRQDGMNQPVWEPVRVPPGAAAVTIELLCGAVLKTIR